MKYNPNFSLIFMQGSGINNSFLASQDENQAYGYVYTYIRAFLRVLGGVTDGMDLCRTRDDAC